jgi:hypothetical protein
VPKNNVFGVKKLVLDEGVMENLFVGGVLSCLLQAFDCWWVIMCDPKQVFMAGKT